VHVLDDGEVDRAVGTVEGAVADQLLDAILDETAERVG
jgi:hypothetical protein